MKFRPSVHFYLALSLGLFILIVLGSATYFWYSHEEQLAEEVDRVLGDSVEKVLFMNQLSGKKEDK